MTRSSWRQWLAAVMVAAAAGAAVLYFTRPQGSTGSTTTALTPGTNDPLARSEIRGILEPDAILAVQHPRFVAADRARVPDKVPVIGVELAGEAHAYPIAFLSRVEIVNDRLGGTNIAVTW